MDARWTTLALGLLLVGSFFVGNAAAHEKKAHADFTPDCVGGWGTTFHDHYGEASYTIVVCHPPMHDPPAETSAPSTDSLPPTASLSSLSLRLATSRG